MNAPTPPTSSAPITAPDATASSRLPLRGWGIEMARRWNGGTYSVFVLHGNIFDVFPAQNGAGISYVPLKTFLVQRLFPERACILFYDIGDGLTFGSSEMQHRFFDWLEVYDRVENTNFHQQGPPRDFVRLAPLLRRFFLKVAEDKQEWNGITLIIDFPQQLIPASDQAGSSLDERMNLVTLLKWACSSNLRELDVGILLVEFPQIRDRKSTRLNSSHTVISYAVFCLKKKKQRKHCI